ncbi:MAG: hypothetical protein EOO68_32500, partial [Moraxellaceae bacterium]
MNKSLLLIAAFLVSNVGWAQENSTATTPRMEANIAANSQTSIAASTQASENNQLPSISLSKTLSNS